MVQLGFDVCLIERSRFPRHHLGESLTPGVVPMLGSVGLSSAIASTPCIRVRDVAVRWNGTEAVREDPREQGILVDRGEFDTALLDHAREIGALVLQPADVRNHTAVDDGWQITVDSQAGSVDIRARFFVDATGRSGRFRGTRRAIAPKTIALYGYWVGSQLPTQPCIEAAEREWFWGVPIPDGSYNTLVFVDGERFRDEPAASLDARLVALLSDSSLSRSVRRARLRAPARAAEATPYVLDECVDVNRISIGDAALAIDPLSSSGVQKAIQTALSGAIVTNTLLRRPENGVAAIRFYRDSIREAADRHHAWAMSHYAAAGRVGRFWVDRSAGAQSTAVSTRAQPVIDDDVPLQVSAHSSWEALPCLGEQYVETRIALRHPNLDGPVAFIGGQQLDLLLHDVRPGVSGRQLTDAWSQRMPAATARTVVRWLSDNGVLERLSRGQST